MQKGEYVESAEYQEHQVDWDEIRVLDRATRPIQLKINKSLHIQRSPQITHLIGMGAMSYWDVGS